MNRLLVELYLPYDGRCYDLELPADMPVSELAPLAAKAVSELAGGFYRPGALCLLCRRADGLPLDAALSPAQLGLANGSRLMLL